MSLSNAASTSYELDQNYVATVYAGVLGKIIGVYLGRPFEQWSNERIERELGEITYYVHDKLGVPLIVTDDDISGTFNFLRALPESGNDPNLTAAQIGDWWLNSIIKNRTILWWSGLGLSTEHTAYLRLAAGHKAPASGSIALNGVAVAEEIGAQIFIDGWGLICPGDPDRAVDFARRASSVSHDGEAIYGAQVVAGLIAMAFVEPDVRKSLIRVQQLIPSDSIISELIDNMLVWSVENGDDWRASLRQIHKTYPYERFGTNCPMVSNHAIVLLGLLHGGGNFSRSLAIANTAGYDTDCNSGNVGCILGVMCGLDGIDKDKDWRGPVADRLYIAAADGGRTVTDAVREAVEIVNSAKSLAGQSPYRPKNGARFHFSFPGSVQGFEVVEPQGNRQEVLLSNIDGRLNISLQQVAPGESVFVATETFLPGNFRQGAGYASLASPTLSSGQTVTALVCARESQPDIDVAISIDVAWGAGVAIDGSTILIKAGEQTVLSMKVPDTGGLPITMVGVKISCRGTDAIVAGALSIDWLTWDGVPSLRLVRPPTSDEITLGSWTNGADSFHWNDLYPDSLVYRAIQNEGTALVCYGTREWSRYEFSANLMPHLVRRAGLVAAVTGLLRYVAVVLDFDQRIRLIRQVDGSQSVLAEFDGTWNLRQTIALSLSVAGTIVTAHAGSETRTAMLDGQPLSGAVGILIDEGHVAFGDVVVKPASV